MSLSIDTSMTQGSIYAQLQNMQRQMNALSNAAAVPVQQALHRPLAEIEPVQEGGPSAGDKIGAFADLLKQAVENVNTLQNDAATAQTNFDLGDRSLSLADVMLSTQRARISFEAMVQVRNKVVEAYRTISQMQI
ncbi:MAG: flagellar hook-basal body complex protein FliE [Succinivibrio sp.]|nr:flagellar hook-basal body complex protein FliE [Succinivibrio sp.]